MTPHPLRRADDAVALDPTVPLLDTERGHGAGQEQTASSRERAGSTEPTQVWQPHGGADASRPRPLIARRHDADTTQRDERLADDNEWPTPRPSNAPVAAPQAVSAPGPTQEPSSPEPAPEPSPEPAPEPQARTSSGPEARPITPRVSLPTPSPTRVGSTGTTKTSFQPPEVVPVPEVPEPGVWNAAAYALNFERARWQRSKAIKILDATIKKETAKLDDALGTLGAQGRSLGVDNRVLKAENQAIDDAEERHAQLERDCADLHHRQAEEDRSFAKLEAERQAKVDGAQSALDKVEQELASLETQRRGLRDQLKAVERQQKNHLKSAEEREEQAAKAAMGDARAGLRRASEELRRDASNLDSERQDMERRLVELERPISQTAARIEARKGELDATRRSLEDAREGHRHRLSELEAEGSRKKHELAQAGAEIQRRLVTLGTLVNLHRIERPELDELYAQVDELRGAIGARSSEIDRLAAEREAYDGNSLTRGRMVLGLVAMVMVLMVILVVAIIV